MGAKVEDLTPKTKLQSYYEHDYEGFLAVLKKNGKKLQVDPARREPAEALRAEFEGVEIDKDALVEERKNFGRFVLASNDVDLDPEPMLNQKKFTLSPSGG